MRLGFADRVFQNAIARFHDMIFERRVRRFDLPCDRSSRLFVNLRAQLRRRVGQSVDRLAENGGQVRHEGLHSLSLKATPFEPSWLMHRSAPNRGPWIAPVRPEAGVHLNPLAETWDGTAAGA